MRALAAGLIIIAATVASGQTGYFRTTMAGTVYHTYLCRPQDISVRWADSNGIPFRTFAAMEANLAAKGYIPKFMMNGGIFDPGGIPTGLLIEDGVVRRPLNLRDGHGNFYLKPNGVFYVDSTGAHITESTRYLTGSARPTFAVQSGPLLLDRGKIHPAFNPASSNRLHRNGVGVLPDGRVLFAMTEPIQSQLPTLYDFAHFFRTNGCMNALFLDGDLSQIALYPRTNALSGNHFGAIIVAADKKIADPSSEPASAPPSTPPADEGAARRIPDGDHP